MGFAAITVSGRIVSCKLDTHTHITSVKVREYLLPIQCHRVAELGKSLCFVREGRWRWANRDSKEERLITVLRREQSGTILLNLPTVWSWFCNYIVLPVYPWCICKIMQIHELDFEHFINATYILPFQAVRWSPAWCGRCLPYMYLRENLILN